MFFNYISLKNVLQCSMEEIVRRAAVGIVPCQKHVTERPVCVLVVVQRGRNLLCVMKVFVIQLFVC